MDRLIYIQDHDGSFIKLEEPRGNLDRNNFLILYQGMDWSGFRTLAGCEKQFSEITSREKNRFGFTVVERF